MWGIGAECNGVELISVGACWSGLERVGAEWNGGERSRAEVSGCCGGERRGANGSAVECSVV